MNTIIRREGLRSAEDFSPSLIDSVRSVRIFHPLLTGETFEKRVIYKGLFSSS